MMDANKDLNKEKLSRDLILLRIRDLVKESTGGKVPVTYFRGKKQIDGI